MAIRFADFHRSRESPSRTDWSKIVRRPVGCREERPHGGKQMSAFEVRE